jgi:hypothetical protein
MRYFEDHESDPDRSFLRHQNRNPNMNLNTFSLGRFLLLLFTLHSMASASVWEINVNTTMTPAGRELPSPTRDQPVYYYPCVVGYREIGSTILPGNKPPAEDSLTHHLAEALASQGYLVTHGEGMKLAPSPSLLLVFRWGDIKSIMYRDVSYDYADGGMPHAVYDRKALGPAIHLVGANKANLADESLRNDLLSAAGDERYYVTIAAYDFAAYYNHHKKILLWVTKMSIPKQELDMEEVVVPLIETGTPFLGRETTTPRVVDIGGPNGNGEAGTPVFKGYVTPAEAPSQH